MIRGRIQKAVLATRHSRRALSLRQPLALDPPAAYNPEIPSPANGTRRLALARTDPSQSSGPQLRFEPITLDWASEINRIWAEGGANTLQLAKIVSMARKQLPRGHWSALWRLPQMPFSKRKADMLVRIARLAGLNEKTFAHLPRGWSILYQLARLDLDQLERLVREGSVNPELTLAEARKLTRRSATHSAGPKRPPVRALLSKLARLVEETLSGWSLDQRDFANAMLREILRWIEKGPPSIPNSPAPSSARHNAFPTHSY